MRVYYIIKKLNIGKKDHAWLVRSKLDYKKWIVQYIDTNLKEDNDLIQIRELIDLLIGLKHQNILEFKEAFTSYKEIYCIAREYIEGKKKIFKFKY